MTDFDYKKYSLENLENWMHDAISSAEATPQEIYDVIKGVVEEQYHYFKNNTQHCYELLALLNGNGKGHIQAYDDYLQCDKDDSSPKCQGAWNDFWEQSYLSGVTDTPEEAEELRKEIKKVREEGGYDWTPKQDRVVRWQLPVQQVIEEGVDNYFVQFPEDLLEAANLKEGDQVEWVDRGDGSYLLRKV